MVLNMALVMLMVSTAYSFDTYVPDIPPECQKQGYCVNVPNYPRRRARELIEELGDGRYLFNRDKLDRSGPAEENIELCRSREEIIIPEAAPDYNGTWYFILNQKKEPLQRYRVEVCQYKGTHGDDDTCNQNIATFRYGYTSACRQKYVLRTMTAIDRAGDIQHDLTFKVPNCCSCVTAHDRI